MTSNAAASLRPGCVVLTMGDRPTELESAVRSALTQDADPRVVVVAQGASVAAPEGTEVIGLDDNVGIPGGRDIGLRSVDADVVFFLDDDARYATPAVMQRVLTAMEARPDLVVVSLRLTDETGETMQRHVPRAGRRSADRSGSVTLFLGGACAIRRAAYLEVGGYCAGFFYGHEEMDLAWRLIDAGYTIDYDAESVVIHPHAPVSQGGTKRWWLLGRNRVWLARRRLPHPVDWIHTLVWLAAGLARVGSKRGRRSYWAGWRSGWRGSVDRDPIGWITVGRLARLGRPPIF